MDKKRGYEKTGLKISNETLRQIRTSPAVRKELDKRAKKIAWIASEQGRVKGYVATDLIREKPRGASSVLAYGHAYNHNRKYNSIVKAFNEVRD